MLVVVCDDDTGSRDRLLSYINRLALERELDVSTQEFISAEALLTAYDGGIVPDAAFLDIYMEGIDGMKGARELRARGYDGEIIFTTSSTDFALEGYEVSAAGYLVKPFDYDTFLHTADTIMRRIGASVKTLHVTDRRIERRVPYRDILYVETDGRYSVIRTKTERIRVLVTMRDLESVLCGEKYFLRCHRSFIVNINHISGAEPGFLTMKNGEHVLLNVKESLRLRQQITNYLCDLMG